LKESNVEFQGRGESTAQLVPVNEITEKAISIIRAAKDNLL